MSFRDLLATRPHVLVRDYPPPIHEINAGFAVIANTTAGHAFLDALPSPATHSMLASLKAGESVF